MSVTKSLFSLVKENNGYFKSDKQAAFLLSQCQEAQVFTAVRSLYNNSYQFHFICDQDGVMLVEKHTSKGVEIWWERDPDHAGFMAKAAERGEENRRRKAVAERFGRIRSIVNGWNARSTDCLIRMMGDKSNDELTKVVAVYASIDNKMKKLDRLSDEIQAEMDSWN